MRHPAPEEVGRIAKAIAVNGQAARNPVLNGLKLKEMLLEDRHPPERQALIGMFPTVPTPSATVVRR
jgi:hypothetical protein